MALSRKRAKELKRLRSAAADLWDEQREVLDAATRVAREARRQAVYVGKEQVAPKLRDTYESQLRPAVHLGVSAARSAAGIAKDHITHDVLPTVSSTLGSLIALREVAKDPHVRDALARINKSGADLTRKGKTIIHPSKTAGPARYIFTTFAIIAAIGVAYAAWQTLRADDELWVTDEDDEGVETTQEPSGAV